MSPTVGDTKKDKAGRTLVYTESSKTPGTFYWRTGTTYGPTSPDGTATPQTQEQKDMVATRNLASSARQIGGADAAQNVYSAAGYSGTPSPATAPRTFDVAAAQAAAPTPRSLSDLEAGGVAGGAPATSQAGLRATLMQQIQQSPAAFSDELTKMVNEKLTGDTKALEGLRADIIGGRAQSLTMPDQFLVGKGFSPSQVQRLKQPEEAGYRARLASLDSRIADRQSRIDKAIEQVRMLEGERKENNIMALQTLLAEQQQDFDNKIKAEQHKMAMDQALADIALSEAKMGGLGSGGSGGTGQVNTELGYDPSKETIYRDVLEMAQRDGITINEAAKEISRYKGVESQSLATETSYYAYSIAQQQAEVDALEKESVQGPVTKAEFYGEKFKEGILSTPLPGLPTGIGGAQMPDFSSVIDFYKGFTK